MGSGGGGHVGDDETTMAVRIHYTVRQRYGSGDISHRDSIHRPQQRREYDRRHASKDKNRQFDISESIEFCKLASTAYLGWTDNSSKGSKA